MAAGALKIKTLFKRYKFKDPVLNVVYDGASVNFTLRVFVRRVLESRTIQTGSTSLSPGSNCGLR